MPTYKTLEQRGLHRVTQLQLGSKTCDRCNVSGLEWRRSKGSGKWVLWQRVLVGNGHDPNMMIDEPHFLTCGNNQPPKATEPVDDGWEALPEVDEAAPVTGELVDLARRVTGADTDKAVRNARTPVEQRIKSISRSLYGHCEYYPEGQCPCFTKRDPSTCERWHQHIDQQIDIERGK